MPYISYVRIALGYSEFMIRFGPTYYLPDCVYGRPVPLLWKVPLTLPHRMEPFV